MPIAGGQRNQARRDRAASDFLIRGRPLRPNRNTAQVTVDELLAYLREAPQVTMVPVKRVVAYRDIRWVGGDAEVTAEKLMELGQRALDHCIPSDHRFVELTRLGGDDETADIVAIDSRLAPADPETGGYYVTIPIQRRGRFAVT